MKKVTVVKVVAQLKLTQTPLMLRVHTIRVYSIIVNTTMGSKKTDASIASYSFAKSSASYP